MKKNYCLLLLMLFSCVGSLEAKKLFIRVFDLQGHRTTKGAVIATTDTSVILLHGNERLEIPVKDIGIIKTKRAFVHPILTGAIIGSLSGALLGLIAHEDHDEASGYFIYETSVGEDIAAGALSGVVIGGVVGTIISATQRRRSIVINGDVKEWQQQKKFFDVILAALHME